ncbi:MAG: flippase-like domain-containing protein [Deltaproteobacteria bacterium]|nr:flippase-like domain-containing protein [Deltaproteobacteria bacterium]
MIYSVRENPGILEQIRWIPIVIVIGALAPLTLLCNALGLRASAQLVKKSKELRSALNVSTSATIANQLPLPAAFMMRVAAIKSTDTSLAESIKATLFVSLIWLACTLFAAAVAGYALGATAIAIILALPAIIALVYANHRLKQKPGRLFGKIALLGMALSAVDTFRVYACFCAMGIDVGLLECLYLTASSAFANAATFIPGGVGIREYLAAGLATATDIPPSQALLAATMNRITGLISAGIVLLLLDLNRDSASPDH